MVVILKEELMRLEKHLDNISEIINGDEDRDGLETYYEYCDYQVKRLRGLLDELTSEFNQTYEMFLQWYDRQSHVVEGY
jgi:tRNA splicing ligase